MQASGWPLVAPVQVMVLYLPHAVPFWKISGLAAAKRPLPGGGLYPMQADAASHVARTYKLDQDKRIE